MPIYDWFSGLATIGGFLYFLTGFMVSYVLHWFRCRIRHKDAKVQWRLGGIAVGIVAILITSFQSQIAYSTAKQTAIEAAACQVEFNKALTERGRITGENDALSREQRSIIYGWIHDLIFPPEPYASMDPNDPVRQSFALMRTEDTDRKFKESIARQEQVVQDRAEHPYPDPTCGK